jgi:hypothetical protein
MPPHSYAVLTCDRQPSDNHLLQTEWKLRRSEVNTVRDDGLDTDAARAAHATLIELLGQVLRAVSFASKGESWIPSGALVSEVPARPQTRASVDGSVSWVPHPAVNIKG